ncbi:hypothetical protein BS50DRAFT_492751 [Corynespora cassiicola Philippines]|uniref:gamma-glutamylcyclotransferase n=1 Tax=Corynespora cassiicola Philippines TaxID=1448308 RepID=A0A2T2NR29_CORCC|nr:hypothetical protein BS50DRAFT_492751 [Corynespora cassiicola Philippines]
MPAAGTFVHRPVTPSGPKGTFYFAYGSNLSPTQMSIRCKSAPRSSIPIAVARLRGWKWHICERGSANIVYTGGVGLQNETWGLVYDLDVEDEKLLDYWEGVDWQAPQAEIVRWNSKEWEDRLGKENVRARMLVYVDEYRTWDGYIRPSYAGRMNRGIREAIEFGLSEEWVANVLRQWVMQGVEAPEGFAGGDGPKD